MLPVSTVCTFLFYVCQELRQVGHLSSQFVAYVILAYVTRCRNSLTHKATFKRFVISFINACYKFWLGRPSSGIKIYDYITENEVNVYIYMHFILFYFESQSHLF